MKRTILTIAIILITVVGTYAQSRVRGYYRSNGTYVQSYQRSQRNYTNHDNYSTIGNSNPFTGSCGTRALDYSPQAFNYGIGQTIFKGVQSGQYYYNSKQKKVYIPKQLGC